MVLGVVSQNFRPEFTSNRIDEVVVFHPLVSNTSLLLLSHSAAASVRTRLEERGYAKSISPTRGAETVERQRLRSGLRARPLKRVLFNSRSKTHWRSKSCLVNWFSAK